MIKYYSYDIFDTCLVRSCGDPLVVFDILAQRILGVNAETAWLMDFAQERKEGEVRARMKYINDFHEDVTIEEIYSCCDFSIFSSMDKSSIMSEEIKIEHEVLLAVRTIKDEIKKLRNSGYGIIFISDMYLPFEFIKRILIEQNLFIDGDKLYLSCHIGKSKSTGNLFRYVIDDLMICANEICHCGDNIRSDFKIPLKIGIKAHLIENRKTEYERVLGNRQYGSQMMDVKTLSSISSAIRLTLEHTPENLVAVDFIAPMFVPFVYNILQDAKDRGIEKIFFFARDSYIFYLIAQQFQYLFPELTLRYLYVSRSSLYLPGIKKINFENISSMFWNFNDIKALDILERLHLKTFDANKYNKNGTDSTSALNAMLSDEGFVNAVALKRTEQRTLAQKYFIQEGLTEGKCAIVDFFGTRKCQLAVNNILEDIGCNRVFAYYFTVSQNRLLGKGYSSFHFVNRGDRNNINSIFAPHDLFEQYFCITQQNRTSSYKELNGKIVPVFEEDINKKDYKEKIFNANKSICIQFAKHYGRLLANANHEMLSNIAFSIYAYFYFVPDIEYIKAFDKMIFSDSVIRNYQLFTKENFFRTRRNYSQPWRFANMMYNCRYPRCLNQVFKKDYERYLNTGIYISTIDKWCIRIEKIIGRIRRLVGFYKMN